MQPLTVSTTTTEAPDAPETTLAQWRRLVEADLKGASFEKKLVRSTFEGVALQPLYTRADLNGVPALATLPGQPPFLRGVRTGGYRQRPWRVAQEITAATAAEFNAAVRRDLMHGQDSVVLAIGTGEGRLPISDRGAFEAALAGVDLAAVPIHLDGGADAFSVAAGFVSHARRQHVALERLAGSVVADPIAAWVRTGRLGESLDTHYDSLAGWTQWAARHAPALQTIGVDGRQWGDAGATAVQELAFALACAADYLLALRDRAVPLRDVAPRLRFQFSIGPQFFTEIAKFRAWRPLWTRVLAAYGVNPKLAAAATVHAATARWNKTRLDPHVNLLRSTTEALSAVLGGCDTLHIAPFDEPVGTSDDFSRRIARNVHALLSEEFGFALTADPAGGSWYIEKLTDTLARHAWVLFQELAAQGGFAAALRKGVPQELTARAAAEKADAAGKRRLALIGTNLYPNPKEKPPRTPAGAAPVKQALSESTVGAAVVHGDWTAQFEAALATADAGGSLPAVAALRPRGDRPETAITALTPFRAATAFEQLRAAAAAHAEPTGRRPQVFLAKMGPVAQHKARADFSAGFFATGGFAITGQTFDTPEAAAEAAAASTAEVAVLCSTDETYPTLVPGFAAAAKARRGALRLVLAGLPADAASVDAYRRAGIDEFIHLRADVAQTLGRLLNQIGDAA